MKLVRRGQGVDVLKGGVLQQQQRLQGVRVLRRQSPGRRIQLLCMVSTSPCVVHLLPRWPAMPGQCTPALLHRWPCCTTLVMLRASCSNGGCGGAFRGNQQVQVGVEWPVPESGKVDVGEHTEQGSRVAEVGGAGGRMGPFPARHLRQVERQRRHLRAGGQRGQRYVSRLATMYALHVFASCGRICIELWVVW